MAGRAPLACDECGWGKRVAIVAMDAWTDGVEIALARSRCVLMERNCRRAKVIALIRPSAIGGKPRHRKDEGQRHAQRPGVAPRHRRLWGLTTTEAQLAPGLANGLTVEDFARGAGNLWRRRLSVKPCRSSMRPEAGLRSAR